MDENMQNPTPKPEDQTQQESPTPETPPEPTPSQPEPAPQQPEPTPQQPEAQATASQSPPEQPTIVETNKDAKMWGMICHLAGLAGFLPFIPLIGSVVGPLILWLIKKDESPFIDDQGKEALNFQITIGIGALICIPLCIIFIGFLLLPLLEIFNLVFIIIASIESNKGTAYRYPFNFRFIK